MGSERRTGGCLCGKVRYEVEIQSNFWTASATPWSPADQDVACRPARTCRNPG